MRSILIGAATVVLIAGCSSSGGSTAGAPVSATPSTPTGRYLAALRHLKLSEGSLDSYDDSTLTTVGKGVCSDLAATPDTTPSDEANTLVRAGWDAVPAEAVVTEARKYLC
ncbi:MAG: hypothetical protein JWQ77_1988 [Jatrophihabitans sp.]|nr:hypothetical protein [Jatrophihabitans sp.]